MRLGMGMLAGLLTGLALGWLVPALAAHPLTGALGELWFNGVRMTVIPIVMTQLVLGLNADVAGGELRRLGLYALGWFLALLTLGASAAALLTPLFLRFVALPSTPAVRTLSTAPNFAEWIATLLPANIVRAAADNQLLALILFSILLGAAVRGIDAARRTALLDVTAAIRDTMLIVIRWMLFAAPLGIAALTASAVAKMGAAMVGAYGLYVIYFCGLLALLTVILYPLAARRIHPRRWAEAVLPAQTLAFGARSSMAALPVLVSAARQRLGFLEQTTGFVLPLAVSTLRYVAPAGQVSGAIFVAQLYGIPLGITEMVTMVIDSVLLSFSAPGVPSSGLLVALPLFQQLGLPSEGLAMLIAADAIPDMFKSMANVTAHMTVATMLHAPRD
jgi:Na+/H+-dicarboxylate symporter